MDELIFRSWLHTVIRPALEKSKYEILVFSTTRLLSRSFLIIIKHTHMVSCSSSSYIYYNLFIYLSRVIALPSVKYNCPVETDVFESRDLGGARRVAS